MLTPPVASPLTPVHPPDVAAANALFYGESWPWSRIRWIINTGQQWGKHMVIALYEWNLFGIMTSIFPEN